MKRLSSPTKFATADFQLDIAQKVRRHLESSQNISFLNEYCQKTARPLPEWTPVSTPGALSVGYTHGMQLLIDGQRFECNGASSRQDAKKSCASAAIEYFEKIGVSFFLQRERNYTSLLHQLCQARGIENPSYTLNGATSFSCVVFVYDQNFYSIHLHSKKSAAKDDASKVAFEQLCLLPDITNIIFMTNPSFVTQVTRQESASVRRQDGIVC
jgi:dsRNA-specific ribonuclease